MVAEETTYLQRAAWICNTLAQQGIAIIAIFLFWILLKNNTLDHVMAWHMVLCTLAYVPLMAEAVILFSPDNLWSQNISRTTRYIIHGAFLTASAIFVTIGISLLSYKMDKQSASAKHFHGDHALAGFVSWLFVLLSVILGLFAAKPQLFKGIIKPVYFKFLHNIVGLVGYGAGMVSLGYALYMRGIKSHATDDEVKAVAYLLGFVTVWSALGAFRSMYHQLKTIVTR